MSCHNMDTGENVCRTLCHTALLTRSLTLVHEPSGARSQHDQAGCSTCGSERPSWLGAKLVSS